MSSNERSTLSVAWLLIILRHQNFFCFLSPANVELCEKLLAEQTLQAMNTLEENAERERELLQARRQ